MVSTSVVVISYCHTAQYAHVLASSHFEDLQLQKLKSRLLQASVVKPQTPCQCQDHILDDFPCFGKALFNVHAFYAVLVWTARAHFV
eukprot:1240902-Amphidinium_carterae.1